MPPPPSPLLIAPGREEEEEEEEATIAAERIRLRWEVGSTIIGRLCCRRPQTFI